MTVNVLLFAGAREMAGQSEIQIDLESGATVAHLCDLLKEKYPDMESLMSSSNWSVDQAYVSLSHELSEGCQVGLIPPVSGG